MNRLERIASGMVVAARELTWNVIRHAPTKLVSNPAGYTIVEGRMGCTLFKGNAKIRTAPTVQPLAKAAQKDFDSHVASEKGVSRQRWMSQMEKEVVREIPDVAVNRRPDYWPSAIFLYNMGLSPSVAARRMIDMIILNKRHTGALLPDAGVVSRKEVVNNIIADRIISKGNNVFEFRDEYFYRHGKTTESFAKGILGQLAKIGLAGDVLDSEDRFNPWPKDSYFTATIRVRRI